MVLAVVGLVVGLVLLVVAADRVVDEAESLSDRLGLSPIVVGALVVGLGTSLPEMVVSGLAAAQRDTIDLAIGNVVGSNAANLTLVLGTGATITRLSAPRPVFISHGGLVLASTLAAVGLLVDGSLARWEGALLLSAMLGAAAWLTITAPIEPALPEPTPPDDGDAGGGAGRGAMTLVVALATVVIGAQLLIGGAVRIAEWLQASEGFIGLTILAIGTSLPELATTIASARRRSVEMIIGNIFGSNVFNSLAVVGVTGVVGTGRLDQTAPAGMIAMAAVTAAVVVIGVVGRSYSRLVGVGLLAVYPVIVVAAH
ncbi:MAG: sodium:calcium antiporter [Actinomycetota bacterium]